MPDATLVTVVIPVHNEDAGVVQRLQDEGRRRGYRVIVVDDHSEPPCPTADARLQVTRGYGAALKMGTSLTTAEYVVFMDGDGQHAWPDVERLVTFREEFELDMAIGDRRVREPTWQRYVGRKALNILATAFAWRWIPDLNGGLRIVRRDLLESYRPILCDRFSFTTSLTLSLLCDEYRVDWLPIHVRTRAQGTSKVSLWRDGAVTLWYIVWIGGALRTRRLRAWLRPLLGWLRPALGLLRPPR